jgi:hypothetical protein
MWWLLPREQMTWVHANFLLGVFMLCAGTLVAGAPRGRTAGLRTPAPSMRRRLRHAGFVLGAIGALGYATLILNSGGLSEAYGGSHGQGESSSGYVREAPFLLIPGLLLFLVANVGRRLSRIDFLWIAAFSAPIAFHGLISASRGPTFMILVTLGVGQYMVKNQRPPLLVALGALGAIGVLVLLLVAHRDMIYIGSEEFEFRGLESAIDFMGAPGPGNEYILGSATVIDTSITGEYQYGARYFIATVIRAIPREMWPSQYEDTIAFFGIKGISAQALGDFSKTLGWIAPEGASMGLLPDVWKQLWWFGQLLLFGLGWFHGFVWRRAVTLGGIWTLAHVILLALSIYTTQQTLQAMLFRFMFLAGSGWLVWRLLVKNTWQRAKNDAALLEPVTSALSGPPGRLRTRLRPGQLLRNGR